MLERLLGEAPDRRPVRDLEVGRPDPHHLTLGGLHPDPGREPVDAEDLDRHWPEHGQDRVRLDSITPLVEPGNKAAGEDADVRFAVVAEANEDVGVRLAELVQRPPVGLRHADALPLDGEGRVGGARRPSGERALLPVVVLPHVAVDHRLEEGHRSPVDVGDEAGASVAERPSRVRADGELRLPLDRVFDRLVQAGRGLLGSELGMVREGVRGSDRLRSATLACAGARPS